MNQVYLPYAHAVAIGAIGVPLGAAGLGYLVHRRFRRASRRPAAQRSPEPVQPALEQAPEEHEIAVLVAPGSTVGTAAERARARIEIANDPIVRRGFIGKRGAPVPHPLHDPDAEEPA